MTRKLLLLLLLTVTCRSTTSSPCAYVGKENIYVTLARWQGWAKKVYNHTASQHEQDTLACEIIGASNAVLK